MEKLSRLTTEQRSNFVAYLDGELSEEETHQIEQMLAQSQVARHELDSLARTWELLDSLPRVQLGEEFTNKTMASVTIKEQSTNSGLLDVVYDRLQLAVLVIGWAVGLTSAAVGGYYLTTQAVPDPTRDIVRDYQLLKDLDRYEEIGSTEFLKQLHNDPTWNEHLKVLNP
jgi:anti-sigma factor RsiW